MKKVLFLPFIALLFCFACNTGFEGDGNANMAPETYTVVDTIVRFGPDRLESEVHVQWWGDDTDGFIPLYEFTFDDPVTASTQWESTASQDSIFVLATPAGQDTLDFKFTVRAIDNDGTPDPTPASLYYPIKNSPPAITFIDGLVNPEISFPVFKVFWEASDPDGEGNLSYLEIFLNDTTGTPFVLPITASSATFEATDPSAASSDARIYINNNVSPENETLSALIMGDTNRVYIRSVDLSESRSAFAASRPLYIKPVSSSVLMVNAYGNSGTTIEEFYADQLSASGITNADRIQIQASDGYGNLTQQSADNLTQTRVFNLFESIIWFGNNAESSLSLAQKTTVDFFNDGGKMLMSVYISSNFDEQSNFLEFTPIQSLTEPVDTTIFMSDTASIVALDANYEDLASTAFFGVVKPFNLVPGAEALYAAELIARDDNTNETFEWEGNNIVAAKKKDDAGNTNFVLSTLELHKLDGDGNMNSFFQQVINNEFGL